MNIDLILEIWRKKTNISFSNHIVIFMFYEKQFFNQIPEEL